MKSANRMRALALAAVLLTLAAASLVLWAVENRDLASIAEYAGGEALVRCSAPGGFYTDDLTIELGKPAFAPRGARIVSTLAGGAPAGRGEIYEGPISIPARGGVRGVVLRAALCRGDEYSETYSWSYFVGKDVFARFGMPVISLITDDDNLFSEETGIFVPGVTYRNYLAAGGDPNTDLTLARCNFNQRGPEWVRDAHMTVYGTRGELIDERGVGLAVSGRSSSGYPLKSLKLISGEAYDREHPKFTGSFWRTYPDVSPWHHAQRFNKMVLKSGGQDYNITQCRWNVVSRLAEEAGMYPVGGEKRVLVYINGAYYGPMTLSEDSSRYNLGEECGIADDEQIGVRKGGEEWWLGEGTYLNDFLMGDLSRAENRAALEENVDIEQYFLYYAIEVLINNVDWPTGNFGIWFYLGETDETKYANKLCRFLLYDVDLAYHPPGSYLRGQYGYEVLDNLLDEESGSPTFQNVMKSGVYRERFLRLLARLAVSTFSPEHVAETVDAVSEPLRAELPYMAPTKYNQDAQSDAAWIDAFVKNWEGNVLLMKEAAMDRPREIAAALEKYMDVDFYELCAQERAALAQRTPEAVTGLVINELCARGGSDWIELYNGGSGAVRLSEYCLSDDDNNFVKYTCPDVVLPAGGYLVINGKSSADLGGYVCNFNLRQGETLRLVRKGTWDVVDRVAVPRLNENESFGRINHSSAWAFFTPCR